MTALEQPLRFPDLASQKFMTRRAWWLIVLNVLLPGSAQVLAGSRRWGRFGMGATFTAWAIVLFAVVLGILWPSALISIGTFGPILFLGHLSIITP